MIIDCLEVFIKCLLNLFVCNIIYLNYKYYNIIKFFVGIIFVGVIFFLFKCWGGWVLDKELIISSGFLDFLEYDD